MSQNEDANEEEGDWTVPGDFPRHRITGVVSGTQSKFIATLYKGRYYMAGCTPPEIYERWRVCEHIAVQLSVKALESKMGKRAHMSEQAILDQYHIRLVDTKWVSVEEAYWIIQKTAQLAGWSMLSVSGPKVD